ncbi:MAG: transposase [Novosphingobium sp.]|nr:transposase [Novosphingobium sp.]
MGQITVFSGPERRRRWSDEERLHILTEAFSPGACVAEVCRRHDISTALIYTWRRKIREAQAEPAQDMLQAPSFAEAVVVEDEGAARPGLQPAMIVELARGKRVSIFASASPAQVASALKALR